jgi:uncharacterized protein (DUF58 family)
MTDTQQVLSNLMSNGVSCQLAELVRYRALASKLNLAPNASVKNNMAGTLSSRFKGRGMEFDEARHYQPGDDIRSIDWRVTARTGKTHTKLYREERERPVLIYVDLTSSMHFGTQLLYKSVQSLHAAALITFSALSRGDKVGCMAVSNSQDIERKPKSTAKHALSMLSQIVDLQQAAVRAPINVGKNTNETRLASSHPESATQLMNQLSMLAKPGALVYVISDFSTFTKNAFTVLGKINRHCEVRPMRVYDPFEIALPKVSGIQDVLVSNGVDDQHILLGDKKLDNQYKQTRDTLFAELKSQLTSFGLPLRQISAALPIEQQLATSRSGLILGEFT